MQNKLKNSLSIAAYEQNPLKRLFLNFLERIMGVRTINDLYLKSTNLNNKPNFWSSALHVLNIDINIHYIKDAEIPREGPLIIVCNHPYGIIDGILLGKIISFYRDDYKFLANEALTKIPEISDTIIPVDLNTLNNKKGKKGNLSSIRKAYSHLDEGGVLIIFPGGEVSSASGIFGTPVDSKWSPLPVKLSRTFDCQILPIYIHGSSSLLFQFITKISFSLRKYFLFREVLKKRNKSIDITINEIHDIDDYNQNFNDMDLSNEIYETMKRDSKYLP